MFGLVFAFFLLLWCRDGVVLCLFVLVEVDYLMVLAGFGLRAFVGCCGVCFWGVLCVCICGFIRNLRSVVVGAVLSCFRCMFFPTFGSLWRFCRAFFSLRCSGLLGYCSF